MYCIPLSKKSSNTRGHSSIYGKYLQEALNRKGYSALTNNWVRPMNRRWQSTFAGTQVLVSRMIQKFEEARSVAFLLIHATTKFPEVTHASLKALLQTPTLFEPFPNTENTQGMMKKGGGVEVAPN